jgi:hypothetical protein
LFLSIIPVHLLPQSISMKTPSALVSGDCTLWRENNNFVMGDEWTLTSWRDSTRSVTSCNRLRRTWTCLRSHKPPCTGLRSPRGWSCRCGRPILCHSLETPIGTHLPSLNLKQKQISLFSLLSCKKIIHCIRYRRGFHSTRSLPREPVRSEYWKISWLSAWILQMTALPTVGFLRDSSSWF